MTIFSKKNLRKLIILFDDMVLILLIFMVMNSIINLISKIYNEYERMKHYVTTHNTPGVLEYLIITPQFDNAIVPFSN